ncbi:MAG: DUF4232 domain-containing protein [Kutzneria sp.]|nr:DUF4232 domain-containing protein [Kutzneria sp.]MBV9843525.1 DUF4232 domain-containing protein [Kutzneria sp.]
MSTIHKAVAAVSGLALAAGIGVIAGNGIASAAPSLAPCQASQLSVSLVGGYVGLGNRATDLVLTSSADCTVHGYPQLFTRVDGAECPVSASQGPTYFRTDPGDHVMALNPGDRVVSQIAWHAGIANATPVGPLTVRLPDIDQPVAHDLDFHLDNQAGDFAVTAVGADASAH